MLQAPMFEGLAFDVGPITQDAGSSAVDTHVRPAVLGRSRPCQSWLRIPLIVTDDSGIVTGHSGDRDRCHG